MSSREITEYMIYFESNPLTEDLVAFHTANLNAMIANALKKKSAKRFKATDFLPQRRIEKTSSPKQMMETLKHALGGRKVTKEERDAIRKSRRKNKRRHKRTPKVS